MIKVNGKDFTAKVGGDFKQALARIKTLEGADYDGESRTWTVAVEFKSFRNWMYGFPFDTGNGTHYTAYGNPYRYEEWQEAKQEMKSEHERALRGLAEQKKVDAELETRCITFVGNAEKGKLLAKLIKSDDGISRANFSTDDKYQAAKVIADWYETESMNTLFTQ